ncbi:RNA-directed DNA polymerase, eukaryota, reverse transcriptase zinc-binding domain protein [Tanacetum coccineum]
MQETALVVTPVLVVAPRSAEGTPPKRYKTKKDDTQNMDFKEEITTSASEGFPPGWIKETRTKIFATHKRTDLVLYIHFIDCVSTRNHILFDISGNQNDENITMSKDVGSPALFRALTALYEKDVDLEFVPVSFANGEHKSPKFLALNAFGQVPAFEHGDLSLFTKSNALRGLPRGGAESSQFTDLMVVIRDVVLSDSRDRWKWALDSKGLFVASVRKHIEEYRLHGGLTSTRWIRFVPIKVNVLT